MTADKPKFPYNCLKLLILLNIFKMNESCTQTTSKRIHTALLEDGREKSLSNITTSLRHYTRFGYLKRTPTPLTIRGGGQSCAFEYKLTAKGEDLMLKMLNRYENGNELNLKKRVDIKSVDFSRYK